VSLGRIIIEVLFMRKEMKTDLQKNYHSLQDLCTQLDDVGLLGLYKPINEDWDWLYLLDMNGFDKWKDIYRFFTEQFGTYGEDPVHCVVRFYEDAMPLLGEDKSVSHWVRSKGRKIFVTESYLTRPHTREDIREFYKTQLETFYKHEAADFLGMFQPWSEGWNWTPMWMMDSLEIYFEMQREFRRRFGRAEAISSAIFRFNERHEP
jgi:hypothetical protein